MARPTTPTAKFDGRIVPFIWAHFWKHNTRTRTMLVAGFLASLIACLCTIFVPYAISRFIDALTHAGTDTFWSDGWLMAFLIMVLQVAAFRARYWLYYLRVLPDISARMRDTLFNRLIAHGTDFFANQFSGSLANKIRLVGDTSESLFDSIVIKLFEVTLYMLVACALLAQINPYYALIIVTTFSAMTILCYYMSKKCNRLSEIKANALSTMVGFLVDVITNHTAVRHFTGWGKERKIFQTHQDHVTRTLRDLSFVYWSIWGFFGFASAVMQGFLLWLIARDFRAGILSVGEITLIVMYGTQLTRQFSDVIFTLPQISSSIGTMREALALIYQPLQHVDKEDAVDLVANEGTITFSHVDFSYPNGHNVFRELSLHIPAGQKIGLVGFSGSGKSTFVHLLLRHYDIQAGRITIDDQDIAEVKLDSLRKSIAAVPQDPVLFHRSLYDNIAYGGDQVQEVNVINAAERASASEFIEVLSEKYQTKVGERGVKLSGGQRQRIAIARAILSKAPILVLDEATSALDSITEGLIQEVLQTAMMDRTTIVIAHRLATLKNLDRIIVLDKGYIIEDGTLEDLIKLDGHFAKLWQMQSNGFLPETPGKDA